MRRLIDRLIRFIARTAMLGWFRSIEVESLSRFPEHAPSVIVAPHFNGFVDPALLAATLPRVPRFLAMSTLWKIPGLGPVLGFVGAVPVYRASEGSTARNEGTFDACHHVLRENGSILIFPEGKVNDRFRLLPLKTGAARIALGARASGARGVQIVPVGTIYEDRSAIRSRAVVRVGEPIVLDAQIANFVPPGETASDENHEAVVRLTNEIQARLGAVTVDFEDAADAKLLEFAAQVSLRDPEAPPWIRISLANAWSVAARVERAGSESREAVLTAARSYRSHLDVLGLDDQDVVPGNTPKRLLRKYRRRAARFVAAAPFAAIGAAVNAVPAAVVHQVGKRVRTRMGQATPKLLASIAVFPLTWLGLALRLRARGNRHPWLAALVAGPGCGLATLYAFERWESNRRDIVAWRRLVRSASTLEDLRERRSAVVGAVERAVAATAPTAASAAATKPASPA
jgi:glycerol-3-phosphate O-acyltransferase / dihydroxyacetone phosphate acyltransferase